MPSLLFPSVLKCGLGETSLLCRMAELCLSFSAAESLSCVLFVSFVPKHAEVEAFFFSPSWQSGRVNLLLCCSFLFELSRWEIVVDFCLQIVPHSSLCIVLLQVSSVFCLVFLVVSTISVFSFRLPSFFIFKCHKNLVLTL